MAAQSTDKILLIKTIYIYLVMIISIILLITGTFRSIQTAVNFAVYDEYPIGYDNCEYLSTPKGAGETEMTAEELSNELTRCEKNNADQRKTRIVEDLTASISFVVVGATLFIPHFRWSKSLDKGKE